MSGLNTVYAKVDASELPFVVVHVVGPLTEPGFDTYLEQLLEAIQLRERIVIRMHAGALAGYPPRYVRTSVAWMKQHREVLTRHVVAVSIVMDSSVLRMATQAMVWAARPSFPMGAVQTRAEADRWLCARLEEDSQ